MALTFYKGDRVVRGVHQIDAAAYVAAGWSTEPLPTDPPESQGELPLSQAEKVEPEPEPEPKPTRRRKTVEDIASDGS